MDIPSSREAVLNQYAQTLIRIKARQLTRKPGFCRSDEDDIAQDLSAHLLAQAHHFNRTRASSNTFAARVIESKARMILRDRRRLKRAAGFSAQSLESTALAQDPRASLRDVIGPADLARRTGRQAQAGGETADDVIEAFLALPSELQDVCVRLIDRPAAAVARDMNISRRELAKHLERIRSRFKMHGLGDA